ncbi:MULTISPECIES: S24 family peptidase [Vreelandella]|nr:S24 family peptidase [Halomonas alkaliphila]
MRSGILPRPASGNSMIGGKIHHGDLLVVNGSRVIVIAVDGDLAVKRLERVHQRAYLRASNPAYRFIPLEGRPIGVLSNNYSCIVARSNELNTLGVAMGTARHLLSLALYRQVILLSRNCALYGDMFHQVTEVLARFSPHAEVYSIY